MQLKKEMGEKDQDLNKTKMHHEYPPPPNSNQELVSKLIGINRTYGVFEKYFFNKKSQSHSQPQLHHISSPQLNQDTTSSSVKC